MWLAVVGACIGMTALLGILILTILDELEEKR